MKKLPQKAFYGIVLSVLLSIIFIEGVVRFSYTAASEKSALATGTFVKLRDQNLRTYTDGVQSSYYGLGLVSQKVGHGEARIHYTIGQALTSGIQKYDIEITPIYLNKNAKSQQSSWEQAGEIFALSALPIEITNSQETTLSGVALLKIHDDANALIVKCKPTGSLQWGSISHTALLENSALANAIMIMKPVKLKKMNGFNFGDIWDEFEADCETYSLTCPNNECPGYTATCKKSKMGYLQQRQLVFLAQLPVMPGREDVKSPVE